MSIVLCGSVLNLWNGNYVVCVEIIVCQRLCLTFLFMLPLQDEKKVEQFESFSVSVWI